MDKKIAIVSWIGTGNFGTSLQSYALHEKLRQLGYHVCILQKITYKQWMLNFLKRIVEGKSKKNSTSSKGLYKLRRFNKENIMFFDFILFPLSVFIETYKCFYNRK